MTVCVAAFAEDSKAIVLVADKAVTYGGPRPIQSDVQLKKILPIGDCGWQALVSGDPTFAVATINRAAALIQDSGSCEAMMGCLKTGYQESREVAIVDQILKPNLLTKELYIARPHALLPLPDSYFGDIAEAISKFKAGTSILVCGFDTHNAPHIFSVIEPGMVRQHDMTGFHSVGIGDRAALGKFLWLETSRTASLARVLYEAFLAKVEAEIVQGVGYEWDAEILVRGNKAVEVPKKIQKIIEQIFYVAVHSPFAKPGDEDDKLDDDDIPPRDWKARLNKFAESVMAQAAA